MEYLLVGFIAFSVTLNLILVWQILRHVEDLSCELLEFDLAEPEKPDDVTVTLFVEPVTDSATKREQPQPQPALQARNHQAWNNGKNIPWSELDRPRQEPVHSDRPGPLERPPGFSR